MSEEQQGGERKSGVLDTLPFGMEGGKSFLKRGEKEPKTVQVPSDEKGNLEFKLAAAKELLARYKSRITGAEAEALHQAKEAAKLNRALTKEIARREALEKEVEDLKAQLSALKERR